MHGEYIKRRMNFGEISIFRKIHVWDTKNAVQIGGKSRESESLNKY